MYPNVQDLVNINGMLTAPFKFAEAIRQADALPGRPVHHHLPLPSNVQH